MMKLPKLTRSRFILLWGAGVALFLLVSWKSLFNSGNTLRSGQSSTGDQLQSSVNAQIPGRHGEILDGKVQGPNQVVRPPSSVLDAMTPKLNTHKDPNVMDLGADGDTDSILSPLGDDGRRAPDGKIPGRRNHNSFLAMPHQEADDDGKSPGRYAEPDGKDSSSQSSYVSSQDDENPEVARERPVKIGLFANDDPPLPQHSLRRDEETDEGALAAPGLSRERYQKKLHRPQGALLNPENRKASGPHQKHKQPHLHQDAQTLPESLNVDRNEGRINVWHQVPTFFASDVVPEDRRTNEVSQESVSKSSDAGLLNDERGQDPTVYVSPDGLDQQQEQFAPSTGPHGEKTDAVVTMEAGNVPAVDSKLPSPRFADYNHPVSLGERKEPVPVLQPHGGPTVPVAVDTTRLIEELDGHPLPDNRPDEHAHGVAAKEPGSVGFRKDGEKTETVPGVPKSTDDATSRSSLKLTDSAKHDPRLPNVILHPPLHEGNVANGNSGRNLPETIAIQTDRRLAQPDAAQLKSGFELRQPQKSDVSSKIQVHRLTGKVDAPRHETEEEFMERMRTVQRERHDLLRQQCQNRHHLSLLDFHHDRQKVLSWKKYYEHAYANDDHRFIICRELKAASFSWRKVMISLYAKGSAQFRRAQAMGDFPMRDYGDDAFLAKLRDYRKILFVREPFARFLSAYRDKYVELRHFPYYRPIGSKIIRTYRRNASPAEIQSGRPTFEEFTRWVVAEEVPEGDYHWRPLFDWYHPCQIPYDFIGKVETAAEDTKYIFKMVGIDKLETFPSTETHHKFSSSPTVLEEFYSQLPPDLLPQLVNRYKEEFELFDYPVPQKMSDIWTNR